MHFDPTFVQSLQLAAMGGLGAVVWWAFRRFIDRIDKQDIVLGRLEVSHVSIRNSLTKIETVVGVDSENGMRGSLRNIEDRVLYLERRDVA